jgi:two-component system sensor histidine kinase SenX3
LVKRLFGRAPSTDTPAVTPGPEPEPREATISTAEPDDYAALRMSFTAAVSHELRTPLARILALLDSASLPGAAVHELIDQARAEVEEAGQLIDEVLFLSELETGSEVVAFGSTAAAPVIRETLETLEDSAARAGVELRFEGDEHLEVPLRPRMLQVIVQNLAENAIRYAGHGSVFTMSIGREPDGVVLAAGDDGIGVAERDLPRVFERFYRADQARASRGTGLGLAIVKHVVGAAGGTVEARGARAAGLEIHCLFPS